EWSRAFGEQFGVTRAAHLLPSLAEIGVRPEDVRTVVISHAHGDHYVWGDGRARRRAAADLPERPSLPGRRSRPARLPPGAAEFALLATPRRPPPPRPPEAGLRRDNRRARRHHPAHPRRITGPSRRSHRIGRPERLLRRRPGSPHR